MPDSSLTRRSFVVASSLVGLAACGVHGEPAAAPGSAAPADAKPGSPKPETGGTNAPGEMESFPRQPLSLVQAVVGASHTNLAKVRELVEARPALAKSAWDWGFGDWESALGAASHTGQREIALFLMANGARPDIFTFAMLGNLDAVRAMVAGSPGVQRTPGPHGIPLLRHAQAGGEAAAEVVKFVLSLGDAGAEAVAVPLASPMSAYTGAYRVEAQPGVAFEILEAKGGLGFKRTGQSQRGLIHLGNNEFHPAGAPAVRLTFEITGARAAAVVIRDQQSIRAVPASY